tara:strand:- start:103 stop:405 length:303 start_codon:yes stop_codon:yes gene_type:complete
MRNKGKKNLTKEILAENINRQFGLTKSFSEKLINSLIFHLTNTVKTDKILKIKNFGTFRILNKKERVGRNPKSKEKFVISKRSVIVFKTSKSLNNKLNKD